MTVKALTAFVAAQLVATQPILAASLEDAPFPGRDAQVRTGAFAGARLRLSLNARRDQPRVKAGIAFAAYQSGRSVRGTSVARFGEGLEIGLTDFRSPPQLRIGGYRLTPGKGPRTDGARRNISTLGAVAIAGGVLAIAAVAVYVAADNASD